MKKITLTTSEVAKVLGVSRASIYTMVSADQIPHFKARGKILFNRNVIEEWTRGEYKHEA